MCILINTKFPKHNEKTKKKTKSLINEKLPKLDQETRKKIDHLLLYKR